MNNIIDINGKIIEIGHIVAVMYGWNSYVGTVRITGLCAEGHSDFSFFSPHRIDEKHTHQIISHSSTSHADYNNEVSYWYHTGSSSACPIQLRVYENMCAPAKKQNKLMNEAIGGSGK